MFDLLKAQVFKHAQSKDKVVFTFEGVEFFDKYANRFTNIERLTKPLTLQN